MKLWVNGSEREVDAHPDTPLLWVLREQLKLHGTKYSCGIGECGACTVLVDGAPTLACQMSLSEVGTSQVVTIEGLSGEVGERVKRAWIDEQVPQCGYCQPGQIMTATAFLTDTQDVTSETIDDTKSSVLCRCGTYPAIKRAILRASGGSK